MILHRVKDDSVLAIFFVIVAANNVSHIIVGPPGSTTYFSTSSHRSCSSENLCTRHFHGTKPIDSKGGTFQSVFVSEATFQSVLVYAAECSHTAALPYYSKGPALIGRGENKQPKRNLSQVHCAPTRKAQAQITSISPLKPPDSSLSQVATPHYSKGLGGSRETVRIEY